MEPLPSAVCRLLELDAHHYRGQQENAKIRHGESALLNHGANSVAVRLLSSKCPINLPSISLNCVPPSAVTGNFHSRPDIIWQYLCNTCMRVCFRDHSFD